MKYIILSIFMFFSVASSYSQESSDRIVEGYVELVEDKDIIKEGDIFAAKLNIWPANTLNQKMIEKLEGKQLIDIFTVLKVKQMKFSENNSEVLEVFLDLKADKASNDMGLYIQEIDNKNIPISLRKFKVLPLKNKIKKLIVRDLEINEIKEFPKWIWATLVALVVVIGLFVRKKILKSRLHEEIRIGRNEKKESLDLIETREDFEGFYRNRSTYKSCFSSLVHFEKLCEMIAQVQYKKEVSDFEISELKRLKSKMMESFNEL